MNHYVPKYMSMKPGMHSNIVEAVGVDAKYHVNCMPGLNTQGQIQIESKIT